MQSVLFAWLVTMVLRESATNVGIAQFCFLLPTTLLILIGGALADRVGARRMVIRSQLLALLPLGGLLYLLLTDQLSFAGLLVYAAAMGTVQAFVTPARDGLLNQVAGAQVQRAVVIASMVQFGLQMIGLGFSAQADNFGAEPLVLAQMLVLLVGVGAFVFIPAEIDSEVSRTHEANQGGRSNLIRRVKTSLAEGARTVFASGAMRNIVWLNIAMGVLFMGAYMVATPLLIREHFSTDASALSQLNMANSLGLFLMTVVLLRLGTLQRPGRALLLAQILGGIVLALGVLPISYWTFVAIIFCWGLCGGVAMSMSRSIMQEQAPAGQRSRVMSFYSLAMMGAGPLGAVLAGFLADQLGPRATLLANGLAMSLFSLLIYFSSPLRLLRTSTEPA